jgi:hypothetical protein
MRARTIAVIIALATACLPAAGGEVYRFGAGVRAGSFGIPNALLDLALYEHPQLSGSSMAFEFHSYGEKGPQSVFSGIYSIEYSHMSGEGYFRVNQYDNRWYGTGEVTQISLTATILMHIFPSSPIHPYIGGGIGIGRISIWAEGTYQDELGTTIHDTLQKKLFVPVGHIPVGIVGNIRDRLLIRVEAGFKNGFYFAGSAAFNF